jgi:hypothetical protein
MHYFGLLLILRKCMVQNVKMQNKKNLRIVFIKAFCLFLYHGRMEFLDQLSDYRQSLKNDCFL